MLLAIRGLLTPIALLLMVAVSLLTISHLLLVRVLVALVLLRRWGIRRVAAVWVVALVICAWRWCAVARLLVLLVLLVRVVRRCLVCALL